MNLLNDIKNLLKDDECHNLKIEIEWDGVTVYLDYDHGLDFKEDNIIPIHYTIIEEFCYIPHDMYCKMYKANDYGLERTEIKLIAKIMDYLDKHKKEINELCRGYLIEDREACKKKHEKTV